MRGFWERNKTQEWQFSVNEYEKDGFNKDTNKNTISKSGLRLQWHQ